MTSLEKLMYPPGPLLFLIPIPVRLLALDASPQLLCRPVPLHFLIPLTGLLAPAAPPLPRWDPALERFIEDVIEDVSNFCAACTAPEVPPFPIRCAMLSGQLLRRQRIRNLRAEHVIANLWEVPKFFIVIMWFQLDLAFDKQRFFYLHYILHQLFA